MIITQNGITIRLKVNDIHVIGRNTQGVRLVKLGSGDKVAALASVAKDDKSEVHNNNDLEKNETVKEKDETEEVN
jgi:DNA gyrase subunit A